MSRPGATASGTTSAAVAANANGQVFYTWWQFGQGGTGWYPLDSRVQTDSAPAAALVGNYLFVIAKDRQGNMQLNQGDLGKPFVGWQPMGFQANVAPAAASAGQTSVAVVVDDNGRVSYTWWQLGQGGNAWHGLDTTVETNAAPTAALVGNYLFVLVKDR